MSSAETTVIGINFGNSYASIAVITKEGKAECIANEDGERQIAAAVSFHGEELYIGNQALPQLVKNAPNTITHFRNLLGKKFSEISLADPAVSLTPSAPLILHPSLPDTPCYAVQVLVPSPAPLLRGTPTPSLPPSSRPSTQHPTPLATPRSEPVPQTRYITPHDAAVLLLKSLHQSAADFLGQTPHAAVLTVPTWFTPAQRQALQAAATEAGVNVLQLLEEETAAAAALLAADEDADTSADRTTLLVDWGATDLALTLLSVRAGLVHVLATTRAPELGTACKGGVDEVLLKHFAKEFTKKSGEALQVCPPTPASARAQTKLALALPHVKRSLTSTSSTSTNKNSTPASTTATPSSKSTQLSIESLHAGLDFTAPLNRTRAAGLLSSVFTRVAAAVRTVLDAAAAPHREDGTPATPTAGPRIDTLLWIGGSAHLATAGLRTALLASPALAPNFDTDRDVRDEAVGAPEEALARGCALHARWSIDAGTGAGTSASGSASAPHVDVNVTRRTVGIIVPQISPSGLANGHAGGGGEDGDGAADEVGGHWIPILHAETPIPARRTVRFGVVSRATEDPEERAGFEVWEVDEVVRVRKVVVPQPPLGDDDDEGDAHKDAEEEEEEEEENIHTIRKCSFLGTLSVPLSPAKKGTTATKSKASSKSKTVERKVEVRIDVGAGGVLSVQGRDAGGAWVVLSLGVEAGRE